MTRVVVFIQENKTTDFYFPSLAVWGADVQAQGIPMSVPPDFDQPHDRSAWVHYAMGDYPAVALSIDNDSVIPYYSWLAKTFTFCDHHIGAETNSTPGHLMTFCGQTPTFRNPPFAGAHPVWDLPTVFRLAERGGHTWGAFPDQNAYPVNLVTELSDASAQSNVHSPGTFAKLAHAGTLPDLCYVWSPSGYDEHPPLTSNSPNYIKNGHDLIWRQVDAVVASGEWQNTMFILTWDDWGGYADHLATPAIETLPDALHPGGFQAVGGSRIPLIVFGGAIEKGIESRVAFTRNDRKDGDRRSRTASAWRSSGGYGPVAGGKTRYVPQASRAAVFRLSHRATDAAPAAACAGCTYPLAWATEQTNASHLAQRGCEVARAHRRQSPSPSPSPSPRRPERRKRCQWSAWQVGRNSLSNSQGIADQGRRTQEGGYARESQYQKGVDGSEAS